MVKNEKDWLWSQELNCWLGVWNGQIKDEFKTYLRMYNKQKKLVLLEFEKERLEKEKVLKELQEKDKLIAELKAKLFI